MKKRIIMANYLYMYHYSNFKSASTVYINRTKEEAIMKSRVVDNPSQISNLILLGT